MGIKTRKKRGRKTHKQETNVGANKTGPNIMIFKKGPVGPYVHQLMEDMITFFAPNVIQSIRVLRSSKMKHILSAAGPLNITHCVIFSKTELGVYMKISKMPQGPTLTFSLKNYSLQRDILANQKRPFSLPAPKDMKPPCFLMKNLQPNLGSQHTQMIASSFLKMFSPIVPNKTTTRSINRCCLLHYNEETDELDLRQYVMKMSQSASTKLINKLLNDKTVPNLQKYENIDEAFDRTGAQSESEAEEDNKLEVSGVNSSSAQKHSVKLKEGGPRITMQLVKIENGVIGGEVLYHKHITYTKEEIRAIKESRERKKQEKLERKAKQEENIKKKLEAKEKHKEECIKGMSAEMQAKALAKQTAEESESDSDESDASDSESDDDAQYYEEAVGEAPEEGTFTERMKRRREKDTDTRDAKKFKAEDAEKLKKEERRKKMKEKFKKLDDKLKKKRPRSFKKRQVKKMKAQLKVKKAQQESEKAAAEAEKTAPPTKGKKNNDKKSNKSKN